MLLRSVGYAFLDLLYPPMCLACNEGIEEHGLPLCKTCLSQLELIDPEERCPHCFTADYIPEKRLCPDCLKNPPILTGVASAFDYLGPAACLIRHLKYQDKPYLSEGCGAYLAAQFLQMNWPFPDRIIPVPMALTHWFGRGYNQSELLAQSLGKLLECPVDNALVRQSGDYSQAGLTRKQRWRLEGSRIQLRSGKELHDQNLLLVDDVMTTGCTLRKCAEALLGGHPAKIYALTFCRAM